MAFNVNEIRSQLTLGGARNSLFQVTFNNPANSSASLKVPFLVRAAQLPSSNLGTIPVPYYGRTIKLAGDRTFDAWTVTVINDEDFLIKNALEEWTNKINSLQGNLRTFGSAAPSQYKAIAEVTQFSKTGLPIRTYKFDGIYPEAVSGIDVDWGQTDTIEEFSVTFQYDFWTVSGLTGDAGGS